MSSTTGKMIGALPIENLSLQFKILAAIFGIGILTVSSYIEVPMIPVPVTMQTAAVLLIGALYGRNLGSITVASWLALAAMGAPLLAGGAGGFQHFAGTTGGYLAGFLLAAYFVGWLSDRGWNGKKPLLALVAMFIGSKIILGLGWAWLASLIGPEKAWQFGVVPFLLGDLAKTIFAVSVLYLVDKAVEKKKKSSES